MTQNQLTVLFDLDDTLLTNDMEIFLPFYMQALCKHMGVAPIEQLGPMLMAGTKQMMVKTLPAMTLEETFDQTFYPGLGIIKEDVRNSVDEFYRVGFNQLKHHTVLRPQARPVVEHCFSKGYQAVIATNPLMPLQANLNRLRWANVPLEDFPYTFITSYETSHFCKPHTAYYAEILGRLGWKQTPVVMIGNSREDDILPALQLGIPGFWLVYEKDMPAVDQIPTGCISGQMDHIPAWLDSIAANQTTPARLAPEGAFAVLQSTPAVVSSFIQNHPSFENELLTGLHLLIDLEIQHNIPAINSIMDANHIEINHLSLKTDGSLSEAFDQFILLRTGMLKQILPHRKNWSGDFPKSETQTELIEGMQNIANSDQETIRQLYHLIET